MRLFTLFVCTSAAVIACSSSDSTPSDGSPHPRDSVDPVDPADSGASGDAGAGGGPGSSLTCASYSYCTSMAVATYKGQSIPQATGGTIPDGLYRLAWVLASKGTGIDKIGEPGVGYLFSGGQFLGLGFGEGYVGTFKTTGSKLELTTTSACDSPTGIKREGSPPGPRSFDYKVDGDTLYLVSDNNPSNARVFVKSQSLCKGVAQVPATPGDSLSCHVQNCGCSEAANKPADASVCKFVSGG